MRQKLAPRWGDRLPSVRSRGDATLSTEARHAARLYRRNCPPIECGLDVQRAGAPRRSREGRCDKPPIMFVVAESVEGNVWRGLRGIFATEEVARRFQESLTGKWANCQVFPATEPAAYSFLLTARGSPSGACGRSVRPSWSACSRRSTAPRRLSGGFRICGSVPIAWAKVPSFLLTRQPANSRDLTGRVPLRVFFPRASACGLGPGWALPARWAGCHLLRNHRVSSTQPLASASERCPWR